MGQGFMPSQMPEAVRAIPNIVWLDVDPSVVATIGKMGQIACNYLTGTFYKKTDDGISINWQLITLGATPTGNPNRVAYFNALGVLSDEAAFQYFENENTCFLGTGHTLTVSTNTVVNIGQSNLLDAVSNSLIAGQALRLTGNVDSCLVTGGGDGINDTVPAGGTVSRAVLIANVGSIVWGVPGSNVSDSIIFANGSTFSNNNSQSIFAGSGVYDNISFACFLGGGGNFQNTARSLSVGHFNSIIGFDNVSLLGDNLLATRSNQTLCGDGYVAEAETLFATGVAGVRVFQVRDDGRVDMNIGGRRDKSRLAPLAVEAIDPNTDYIVLLNNGAAQTVNLPAGVDGMTYFIKDASGVAGHTINANGADVFEGGAAALVMGAPYRSYQLHFQTGVWYILAIS